MLRFWLSAPVFWSAVLEVVKCFGHYKLSNAPRFVECSVAWYPTSVPHLYYALAKYCYLGTLELIGCCADSVGIVRWSCPAWSHLHGVKFRPLLVLWRNQKTWGCSVVGLNFIDLFGKTVPNLLRIPQCGKRILFAARFLLNTVSTCCIWKYISGV